MKILSTGQSVKSTGQSNKSTEGANERTMNSDANPHVSPTSDPNAKLKGAAKVEYTEKPMGNGNAEGVNGPGTMMRGHDAAHEPICKHPSREYDPAMR